MLNIYVAHKKDSVYAETLYNVINSSNLAKTYNIIFPHENGGKDFNSKEVISKCSFVLAEVSDHATGVGVELGWADAYNIPIICLHREWCKPSGTLTYLTDKFYSYGSRHSLLTVLNDLWETLK